VKTKKSVKAGRRASDRDRGGGASRQAPIAKLADRAHYSSPDILHVQTATGATNMRRILLVGLLALTPALVHAQRQPYQVVFDLTSRDTLEQKAVLRWIKEVGTASPDARMEVVMYAKGFELVMPERSAFIADVKEAMKNPNVSFKVCAIALRNSNVAPSQLLSGVQTVPDGIYEIISKQQEHWGYIKVVH
jgi:intracellular sulfur oxidation DsrE/DsrF family protein